MQNKVRNVTQRNKALKHRKKSFVENQRGQRFCGNYTRTMDQRRMDSELINRGRELFNRSINFIPQNNSRKPAIINSLIPKVPLLKKRMDYFLGLKKACNDSEKESNPQAPCNATISKKAREVISKYQRIQLGQRHKSVPNTKILNEMEADQRDEQNKLSTIKEDEAINNIFHQSSLHFHDPVYNFHMKKKLEKTELHQQVIQLKSEKELLKLDLSRFQRQTIQDKETINQLLQKIQHNKSSIDEFEYEELKCKFENAQEENKAFKFEIKELKIKLLNDDFKELFLSKSRENHLLIEEQKVLRQQLYEFEKQIKKLSNKIKKKRGRKDSPIKIHKNLLVSFNRQKVLKKEETEKTLIRKETEETVYIETIDISQDVVQRKNEPKGVLAPKLGNLFQKTFPKSHYHHPSNPNKKSKRSTRNNRSKKLQRNSSKPRILTENEELLQNLARTTPRLFGNLSPSLQSTFLQIMEKSMRSKQQLFQQENKVEERLNKRKRTKAKKLQSDRWMQRRKTGTIMGRLRAIARHKK